MSEIHPLRAAVQAAEAELRAADDAVEELNADESIDADDPRYDAARRRAYYAGLALEAARDGLDDSDCPREWSVRDDNGEFWSGQATSARQAFRLSAPTTDPSDFGDGTSTTWYTVYVDCKETGEHGTFTVRVDPDEPACLGAEHDWQSPQEIVGGIKENPGVYGHGGGVRITECCVRCGCKRVTDTWAQRPDTGEQGLTSVAYEEGYFAEALERLGAEE